MEDEDGNSYFMEVYDQIRSVDLVLRGSDHPKQIEIEPHTVTTRKNDGATDVYPLVVSVEPTSCTSLQKHINEGVGLRLQMREETKEPQTTFLTTTVKRVGTEVGRMERGSCQCGCKTCGLTLFLDDVKFARVLPLPSQTWRDLFDNWSCCSNGRDDAKKWSPAFFAKSTLKPREGDCLMDDFNILVHNKTVEKKNILLRKPFRKISGELNSLCVKCARCRAEVGEALFHEKKLDSFKLYKSSIEVLSLKKHVTESVIRPIFFSEFFLERLLAQQLSNAVQTHSTHLFVIQDIDEKKPYALVRVMNTRSRLFVNNGKANNEVSDLTSEIFSKTIKDGAQSPSDCNKSKPSGNTVPHEGGCGDCPAASQSKSAEDLKADLKDDKGAGERIRQDGPPRMQGNKVAEVIEKLFSFSTHLISIGRTCSDLRNADLSGCERIVKVTYSNACSDGAPNELSAKWLKDVRTLTLSYPKRICIQILLVLVSSTLTMPVAHRIVDDFMVGFLRLD